MSLIKRGDIWWIRISYNGERIQRSTGTSNKIAAQEYHDKVKAELWSVSKLKSRPVYSWKEAVVRWLREAQHKRSIECDKMHLRWLDPHLNRLNLQDLNRDKIESVAILKEEEGVSPATVNRLLEIIRAILRKAQEDWECIDKIPKIRMRHEDNRRIRWLTQTEAARLLQELPAHLADMVAFTLVTGLRASNVSGLKWKDIDLIKGHAWIHPDQAKTKKAIAVPLNETALSILNKNKNKHPEFVFTYHNHVRLNNVIQKPGEMR